MTNVVALQNRFNGSQLELIRRTVASDCNASEFDLFVAAAGRAGLDPFRKQISAIVFNKGNAEKRRMAIITTIDGLRTLAARSLRYRPDEDEPEFTYDEALKDPATNPLGIEKARVRVFIRDEGGHEWRRVAGVAYWSEFAPLKDEWAENERTGRREKTGRQTLDLSGNWGRMPRVMLAKCAEAQALRKAFPEDLSGLYEGAELEQAQAAELLPSEVVDIQQAEDRLTRLGIAKAITFQLTPASPLEPVPLGQVADRVLEALDGADLRVHRWFADANRVALQEFWARSQGDALELKRRMEAMRAELEKADA